ncbi:hypothetical protein ACE193_09545 [Bernardetia sp. OM2101]|uniref:hypothetical protein n=1 Tax=Bernardetia sp. OM2101 TaxID=3344876 RepID=UPI0035CFC844
MRKILDQAKRNKTWGVIILANLTLLLPLYLALSNAKAGMETLIIAVVALVSVLAINPIIALILVLFTDSKDWEKWLFAACIVFSIISSFILYALYAS